MSETFHQRVYEVVRKIPKGTVSTYGQVALLAGSPRAARIVGGALHRNPEPGVLPCHRVVFRDGTLCHAYVFGGEGVQHQLLEQEGITFLEDGRVDIGRHIWNGETAPHSERASKPEKL